MSSPQTSLPGISATSTPSGSLPGGGSVLSGLGVFAPNHMLSGHMTASHHSQHGLGGSVGNTLLPLSQSRQHNHLGMMNVT